MGGESADARELIHGLGRAELEAAVAALGEPAYRAGQLWRWLYVRRARAWDAMGNLPAGFRRRLAERFAIEPVTPLELSGAPAETRKGLLGLRDGECVEIVLIPAPARGGETRRTVCVSSQVGCRFACAFCASGKGGFRRNLGAGEIVGEVLQAFEWFGARPTNIVFMGIGEPLDNYDEVLRAVRILNDADGLAFGARHITLSTCGVVPGIRRLAGEGLQVELSVSLHAPEDALRSTLMPVNRAYPLAELLAACADYTGRTGRIVTFEYTLVRGVNDSEAHARALAAKIRPLRGRVNLIPLSDVEGFAGEAPPRPAAAAFMRALKGAGVNATLRASKGGRIRAACGQLRLRTLRGASGGGGGA